MGTTPPATVVTLGCRPAAPTLPLLDCAVGALLALLGCFVLGAEVLMGRVQALRSGPRLDQPYLIDQLDESEQRTDC